MAILNATATSLGTSTTKTILNAGSNITIPAWAREIVAFVPYAVSVTLTADQKLQPKLTVESDDVALAPFEAMLPPVGGGIGADIGSFAPKLEKFPMHCPVHGGEELTINGTALVANTVAPYMGCSIVVADRRTGRQLFSKCGTLTDTGTSAGEASGTAYSIHGSERIVEVIGSVGGTKLDDSKPVLGYVRLDSNDFKVAVPLKFAVTPQPTVLGALVNGDIGGLTRFAVDVPTNTTCTIQDYFNLEVAVTTTGKWLSQVVFNKVGRN